MTMVDWLLTEQLVQIFREAGAKRPELNATLVARSPLGEEDVLAGQGEPSAACVPGAHSASDRGGGHPFLRAR